MNQFDLKTTALRLLVVAPAAGARACAVGRVRFRKALTRWTPGGGLYPNARAIAICSLFPANHVVLLTKIDELHGTQMISLKAEVNLADRGQAPLVPRHQSV